MENRSSDLCQSRLYGVPATVQPAVPTGKCDLCGLTFSRDRLHRIGRLILCPSCEEVYCDACYPLFSDDFIEQSGHSFYTGWFEGLDPTEQLDCLRAAYQKKYRTSTRAVRADMRTQRREFCSSRVNEDWPAYVAHRLNAAYHNILN